MNMAVPNASRTILKVNTSGRHAGSMSRDIVEDLVAALRERHGGMVVSRELSGGVPMVDDGWIRAAYTDPDKRTPADADSLALSDALIGELQQAEAIVIGLPMYNFTVPASFKAWIDQICRARVTFQYSEKGFEGMLKGKTVYAVVTTGGVPLDSPVDFLSPYLRHIFGFVGITDVRIIDAARLNFEGDAKIAAAKASALKAMDQRVAA
jgi:FMN-dependent NADH-azoreductase